ncbi:hypothetical protein POP12_017 [Pectobacterium phage POP12]|nr:hypothetical protein POP12_017 [Pectobacterium phage POP12]
MKLEPRYCVFKVKDVESMRSLGLVSDQEVEFLTSLSKRIAHYRTSVGKTDLEAVVIEHDWPQYQDAVNSLNLKTNKDISDYGHTYIFTDGQYERCVVHSSAPTVKRLTMYNGYDCLLVRPNGSKEYVDSGKFFGVSMDYVVKR